MDCYLHIGTGKTGTSTIQRFLAENRRKLLKKHYLVPTVPGKARHTKLYLYSLDDKRIVNQPAWRRMKLEDPAAFRTEFSDSFIEEVKSGNVRNVVLTDEGLASLTSNEIVKLKSLLNPVFDKIFIVVYLRRQDEHMVSRYQQTLKVGNTQTIDQFLKKPFGQTYDYQSKLRLWAGHFGADALRPRIFDKKEFRGGSLVEDFLHTIGLSKSKSYKEVAPQNESIDADQAEFLRLFNECISKSGNKNGIDLPRTRLIEQLVKTAAGDKIILPEKVLNAFMDNWSASNAAVAREYFDREDGVLFQTPRRKSNSKVSGEPDYAKIMEVFCRLWMPKTFAVKKPL